MSFLKNALTEAQRRELRNHQDAMLAPKLLLTTKQARVIQFALFNLREIHARTWFRMPVNDDTGEWVEVREDDTGGVHIIRGPLRRFDDRESMVLPYGRVEAYGSVTAFHAAYS